MNKKLFEERWTAVQAREFAAEVSSFVSASTDASVTAQREEAFAELRKALDALKEAAYAPAERVRRKTKTSELRSLFSSDVRQIGELTVREASAITGVPLKTLRHRFERAAKRGELVRERRGVYRLSIPDAMLYTRHPDCDLCDTLAEDQAAKSAT